MNLDRFVRGNKNERRSKGWKSFRRTHESLSFSASLSSFLWHSFSITSFATEDHLPLSYTNRILHIHIQLRHLKRAQEI